MRRAVVGIVALIVITLFWGCGEKTGGLSAAASARLSPQVQQLRSAAAAGDRVTATAALADLRRTVTDLAAAGQIGESDAAAVLAAATEVEVQLALIPTTIAAPPVTRSPVVTTPTVPTEDGDSGDDRGGRKRGKDD